MPDWIHEVIDPETGETKEVVRVRRMRNIETGEIEYWDWDREWTFGCGYAFIITDDNDFEEIDHGKRTRKI